MNTQRNHNKRKMIFQLSCIRKVTRINDCKVYFPHKEDLYDSESIRLRCNNESTFGF